MPSFLFGEDLLRALQDPQTVKVLSAAGKGGGVHAVFLDTLDVDEAGELLLPARLENGVLNQSLLFSLWFGRTVSVSLRAPDGRTFEIAARPLRCHVTGKLFERYYDLVRASDPQTDLASLWVLAPASAREETYAARRAEEDRAHPLFLHLDRIANH